MPTDTLNEREFELINIIGAQLGSNQRDLSRHMDLSLGMTNMLIRRLINKGYIRMRQLNKRKVEYLLTSKGITEKTQKSIKYTLKTIRSIGLIKDQLKKLVQRFYDIGQRDFYLLGESDLVVLVEMAFRESSLPDCNVERIKKIPRYKIEGTILICTENLDYTQSNGNFIIDIMTALANDTDFLSLVEAKQEI